MTAAFFDYPKAAAFGRVVPKSRIYEHAGASTALRDLFVTQVDQIVWKYKLAPETTNLAATKAVSEIQVFSISLRNRSVLVLCPKKLADNWRNYNTNLTTNIFAKDRFNYDVLSHTDLSRTSGEAFGIPLNRVNWGNYDLVVIDESHNFRNNDVFKDRETRYQKLMNKVIRAGVKTKVLMLSATPVNNRFNDLRNQLALAYEGDSENLSRKLKTKTGIEEIFRRAQKAFNAWSGTNHFVVLG